MFTKKLRANIIFNGEKRKAFSVRSGRSQGYYLLPFLFNIKLVLATAIRKGVQIEKEKINFCSQMTPYRKSERNYKF